MTVCIAAACETSSTIVTASDRFAVWDYTSSDNVLLKLVRIHHPQWIAMIAGDDIGVGVENVVRQTDAALAIDNQPSTNLALQGALLAAWRDQQNQVGQSRVLNPYRLTVEEFIQDGRRIFGDAKFSDLSTELAVASTLRCQLLVCGFDDKKRSTLLVCDDEYGCRDYSRAGFVAIGSGHMQAIGSLAFHEYDTMCGLDQAVYRVCAAKFMAEKSVGVGKETMVLCLREDGKTKWLFKKAIEPIRKLWEQEGRPRVPPETNIANEIGPILGYQQWTDF